jgi:hypothetical protein
MNDWDVNAGKNVSAATPYKMAVDQLRQLTAHLLVLETPPRNAARDSD